jgi:hypothetical protein
MPLHIQTLKIVFNINLGAVQELIIRLIAVYYVYYGGFEDSLSISFPDVISYLNSRLTF